MWRAPRGQAISAPPASPPLPRCPGRGQRRARSLRGVLFLSSLPTAPRPRPRDPRPTAWGSTHPNALTRSLDLSSLLSTEPSSGRQDRLLWTDVPPAYVSGRGSCWTRGRGTRGCWTRGWEPGGHLPGRGGGAEGHGRLPGAAGHQALRELLASGHRCVLGRGPAPRSSHQTRAERQQRVVLIQPGLVPPPRLAWPWEVLHRPLAARPEQPGTQLGFGEILLKLLIQRPQSGDFLG